MSRNDFAPDLRADLDGFTAPAPRGDFTDRIMAAVTQPGSRSPSSRDRRGGWRLARRVIIGTVAAGMVSAAAVASGLLGAAGIRVPVLTAMLAPEPAAKPKTVPKPVQKQALVKKPPVVVTQPENPGPADPGPLIGQGQAGTRTAKAIERRAERRAFVQAHPELKPVIRQAMQQQRAFVQANPQVREVWRMPPAERRAYLAENPELRAAIKAHQAERRALAKANPEIAETLRIRVQTKAAERRAARRAMVQNTVPASPMLPNAEGNVADPR
jgi:hypothetical protein